jgi:hypothetical protein
MKPFLNNRIRKGDNFLAAWKRVNDQFTHGSPRLLAHPILKKRVTPHGTIVKNFSPDTWDHPFRIKVSTEFLSVSTGTVNGIIPYINTVNGGYLRLNGLNESGDFDYDSGVVPIMKMDTSKINDDRTTYVMIKIKRNQESGLFGTKVDKEGNVTATTPEDIQISFEKEFEGPTAASGANEFGYHPIGLIRFDTATTDVVTAFQICHFNLRYAYQDRRASLAEIAENPNDFTVGRHVFYPS